MIRSSRRHLRGYSWITVCPEELSRRLGGTYERTASGALSRVLPPAAGGVVLQATDDPLARLSPLQFDHINFRGRYAFTASQPAPGLRPLRDPVATGDADEA